MRYTTRIAIAMTMGLVPAMANAGAEQRVEGTVLGAKVTYCEAAKTAGCTGNLTLETSNNGKTETRLIKVPLGTPITRRCEPVSLRSLEGKTVIVTEVCEKESPLARAITVPDAKDAAC